MKESRESLRKVVMHLPGRPVSVMITASAGMIVFLVGLLLTWKGAEDEGGGAGEERIVSSSRVSSSGAGLSEAEGSLEDADRKNGGSEKGKGTARADFRWAKPAALVAIDAPPEETEEEVIQEEKELEQGRAVQNLRMMLLKEAATRAIHSERPWVELSLVALAFKEVGESERAEYWLKRAARSAHHSNDPEATSRAMSEVVKKTVSAGYFKLAEKLLEDIPVKRVRALAQADLVKAHARKRNFEAARALADGLANGRARSTAFSHLAKAEARHRSLGEIGKTLLQIKDQAIRQKALASVAVSRATIGDTEGSTAFLKEITDEGARMRTGDQIANLSKRGKGVPKAVLAQLLRDRSLQGAAVRGLLEKEARKQGLNGSAVQREGRGQILSRDEVQEAVVRLQLGDGQVDQARRRAQGIGSAEIRNRLLQSISVAEVRKYGAKAARATATLIADEAVSDRTYRKIAQRAMAVGQDRGASDTIRVIRNPLQRALASANVALINARKGEGRQARQFLNDAHRDLREVTQKKGQDEAQTVVAEVFALTGANQSAIRTAAGIENHGLRDRAYQRLAVSFAKVNELRLADRSTQLIRREKTRESTIQSVTKTLAARVPMTEAIKYAAKLPGRSQQVRFLLGVAQRKS